MLARNRRNNPEFTRALRYIEHNQAAQMHALVARRAGATWEELHKVVELAAATGALGPANQGGFMLKALRDKEAGG